MATRRIKNQSHTMSQSKVMSANVKSVVKKMFPTYHCIKKYPQVIPFNRTDPDNIFEAILVDKNVLKIPNTYACAVLLIKWLKFSLKYEKNNFSQKIIISWKISKFFKSDWKQHRNSLRPFLVVFQTTFEKPWKIILKNNLVDIMKKSTFFQLSA